MRRLFFALAAGMMAGWLVLTGCSGDHATAGTSTAGTGGSSASSNTSSASGISAGAAAVQAYCDSAADAFCEAYFACCPTPETVVATKEDCKHAYGPEGGCLGGPGVQSSYATLIDAGYLVLDQARLDAYVARFKSMSPGGASCVQAALLVFFINDFPAAFQGQVAVGAPCDRDVCAHGLCYDSTHTCQALAQLGQPCGSFVNGVFQECERGEDLRCAPHPPPGGPYSCTHQGDIGEPCTQGAECKSWSCDSTSGTCVLPPPDTTCY